MSQNYTAKLEIRNPLFADFFIGVALSRVDL